LSLRERILQGVYAGATASNVLELTGGLRLMAEQQNTLGKPRHREGDEVEVYVDPEAIYAVSDSYSREVIMSRRIGIIVPFDFALDREYWQYASAEASLHITRTPYQMGPVST